MDWLTSLFGASNSQPSRGQYTGTPDGVGPMQPGQQDNADFMQGLLSNQQASPYANMTSQTPPAQAQQINSQGQPQGLMNMAMAKEQQGPAPGSPYANPYVQSLMGGF